MRTDSLLAGHALIDGTGCDHAAGSVRVTRYEITASMTMTAIAETMLFKASNYRSFGRSFRRKCSVCFDIAV